MSSVISLARSVHVPPDAASVGVVRRALAEVLGEGRTDQDTVDTAALLVSEVVTNAVLHADTEIVVRIRVGPGVLVEVDDTSAELPRSRPHAADSLGGRGLDLVEALAAGYGVIVRGNGSKSVWFTLGEAEAPSAPGWPVREPVLEQIGVLLNLPVGLYRVLQDYTEALLRDYELAHLNDVNRRSRDAFNAAVRTRTRFAERTLQALADLADSAHADTPILAGPEDPRGFRDLLDAFAAAESALRSGALLTPVPVPELLALRTWILDEIRLQAVGEPAHPWVLGPATTRPRPPLPSTNPARWVESAADALVAADRVNRILAVSSPAAALLGWDAQELVGQRLTVIIPEDWREQHLAGFSRHQLTGETRIIGHDVDVPVLRRDGTTMPVRLRLEARTTGLTTWYLGRMGPAIDAGFL